MTSTRGYILASLAAIGLLTSAVRAAAPASAPATAPTASQASRPVDESALVPWRTDYARAIEDARQANQPVLVRGGAVWCVPCRMRNP